MAKLDRPILVTGTPRSGKSVVAQVLANDPAFCLVTEPIAIWNTGMPNRADDVRPAQEATPTIARQIEQQCAEVVEREGKTRYVDDLAYHALRLGFAHQVLPDARIVHIVRNSRDAIPEMLFGWTFKDSVSGAFQRRRKNLRLRSLPRMGMRFAKNYLTSRLQGRRATWGPRVPGQREFAASHSVAEVASYQWCQMVKIAMTELSQLPPQNTLQVFFEDLIAQPAQTARRIATFCGQSDPDKTAQFAQSFIDPDFVFDRVIQPTETEQAKIDILVRPIQDQIDQLCAESG